MPRYHVYGVVTGSKYLGVYEADSVDEAEEAAWAAAYTNLCHQCDSECDGAEIHKLVVELDEDS